MASKDHDPKEQPLIAHLIELRDRIIRSLVSVIAVFLPLFIFFYKDVVHYFLEPVLSAMGPGQEIIATQALGSIMIPLTLTFMVAFFICIPYILFQIWSFVEPGLYQREISVTKPILLSSIILFYVGIAFAYFVVMPILFKFIFSSAPGDIKVTPDISSLYDLIIRMCFIFGFVFEIPIATIMLILSGVVDSEKLKQHRGYVIIACFTIPIFFTPPDVFSQSLVAIPMWMLFESGLFFGKMMKRKRAEAKAAS